MQKLGIECKKLYDNTICIGDEFAPELCNKGTWYRLESEFTDSLHAVGGSRESVFNCCRVENKTDALKLLAASKTVGIHRPYNFYYEIMEESGLNIYTREDLYDHLMSMRLDEESAFYWTEMIGKGKFCRKVEANAIDYGTYIELYETWGKQILDLFTETYFLPSRWNVLEEFYRLSKWENEKKIIAVDFDGTLSLGEWPNNGPANTELIGFLKERRKGGDKLILWTCREGNALQEAVKWCAKEGLEFDAINDNIPEMIELYGTNSRKVSCDYYIDDKAVWTNAFGLLK